MLLLLEAAVSPGLDGFKLPDRMAASCGPSRRPGTETATRLVRKAKALAPLRTASEAVASSRLGRPIKMAVPAAATKGGEFKPERKRRLMVIIDIEVMQ